MSNHLDPQKPLLSQTDRQKIIEQAKLVLTEARAIAEKCDQTFALLSAERPAECTTAAASCSLPQGAAVQATIS
jgi:hypothetical protein